jgi:hypothetical protein
MPAMKWAREGSALALVVANDLPPHSQKELAAVRDADDIAPITLTGPNTSLMGTALGQSSADVVALGHGALGRRLFHEFKRVAPLAAWSDDSIGGVGEALS